jgi:hypothetical protein
LTDLNGAHISPVYSDIFLVLLKYASSVALWNDEVVYIRTNNCLIVRVVGDNTFDIINIFCLRIILSVCELAGNVIYSVIFACLERIRRPFGWMIVFFVDRFQKVFINSINLIIETSCCSRMFD